MPMAVALLGFSKRCDALSRGRARADFIGRAIAATEFN